MLALNTPVKICKNSQIISRTVYERTKRVPKFVQPPENIPKQLNPIHLYYSETLTRLTDSKDFDAIWASWDKFRKIHNGGDVVVWNQMLNVCLLTGLLQFSFPCLISEETLRKEFCYSTICKRLAFNTTTVLPELL
jgi:hypothetical protein